MQSSFLAALRGSLSWVWPFRCVFSRIQESVFQVHTKGKDQQMPQEQELLECLATNSHAWHFDWYVQLTLKTKLHTIQEWYSCRLLLFLFFWQWTHKLMTKLKNKPRILSSPFMTNNPLSLIKQSILLSFRRQMLSFQYKISFSMGITYKEMSWHFQRSLLYVSANLIFFLFLVNSQVWFGVYSWKSVSKSPYASRLLMDRGH